LIDSVLAQPLRVEPLRELGAADEWDRLARASGNLFATPEWALTWWEVFGDRGRLMSFACRREDGRAVAVLPMFVSGAGTRVLRFLGHGDADLLGPICAPADRARVADATRRILRDWRSEFDVFVGDDLPLDAGWGSALGARRLRRTSSPVLRAPDWRTFLANRSANFRQQLRRRERTLGLRHRLCTDPTRLRADLDTLFRLHAARWGRPGSFAGRLATFHRAFAAKALRRGWLRLWIAELDERPVAAWYGFRYGGAEWYYQAGRDPRVASAGFVLLAHTIRAALDDGIGEYRLLRGDEPYKLRFATADAPLETVMLGRD
jgi:CelD/BcsL family acetyltransferase involved in cellulose biosynthesis